MKKCVQNSIYFHQSAPTILCSLRPWRTSASGSFGVPKKNSERSLARGSEKRCKRSFRRSPTRTSPWISSGGAIWKVRLPEHQAETNGAKALSGSCFPQVLLKVHVHFCLELRQVFHLQPLFGIPSGTSPKSLHPKPSPQKPAPKTLHTKPQAWNCELHAFQTKAADPSLHFAATRAGIRRESPTT